MSHSLCCVIVFSCSSLSNYCVSSVGGSICLSVFSSCCLRELFIHISKISIIMVEKDLEPEPHFYGVFYKPLLAVVGELGSNVVRLSWFPLLKFSCFSPAIMLSVIMCGLVVSDWCQSLPRMWGLTRTKGKFLLSVRHFVGKLWVLLAVTQPCLCELRCGSSSEAVLGAQPSELLSWVLLAGTWGFLCSKKYPFRARTELSTHWELQVCLSGPMYQAHLWSSC